MAAGPAAVDVDNIPLMDRFGLRKDDLNPYASGVNPIERKQPPKPTGYSPHGAMAINPRVWIDMTSKSPSPKPQKSPPPLVKAGMAATVMPVKTGSAAMPIAVGNQNSHVDKSDSGGASGNTGVSSAPENLGSFVAGPVEWRLSDGTQLIRKNRAFNAKGRDGIHPITKAHYRQCYKPDCFNKPEKWKLLNIDNFFPEGKSKTEFQGACQDCVRMRLKSLEPSKKKKNVPPQPKETRKRKRPTKSSGNDDKKDRVPHAAVNESDKESDTESDDDEIPPADMRLVRGTGSDFHKAVDHLGRTWIQCLGVECRGRLRQLTTRFFRTMTASRSFASKCLKCEAKESQSSEPNANIGGAAMDSNASGGGGGGGAVDSNTNGGGDVGGGAMDSNATAGGGGGGAMNSNASSGGGGGGGAMNSNASSDGGGRAVSASAAVANQISTPLPTQSHVPHTPNVENSSSSSSSSSAAMMDDSELDQTLQTIEAQFNSQKEEFKRLDDMEREMKKRHEQNVERIGHLEEMSKKMKQIVESTAQKTNRIAEYQREEERLKQKAREVTQLIVELRR